MSGRFRVGDLIAYLAAQFDIPYEQAAELWARTRPIVQLFDLAADEPLGLALGYNNSLGGLAGNPGTFRLRNPTGSDVLCIVEAIEMSCETAPGGILTITTNDQTTGLPAAGPVEARGQMRDTRISTSATLAGACLISAENVAPAGNRVTQVFSPDTAGPYYYRHRLWLAPGHSVDFGTLTNLMTIRAGVTTREVPLTDVILR